VFLLGHWKDYEELEESISMPELTATLKAMYKVENRNNKFIAAMQGVDLDSNNTSSDSTDKPSTFQEVQARAVSKLTNNENLAGAAQLGLSPDMGIGYAVLRSGE
jgi:hypothetical protein